MGKTKKFFLIFILSLVLILFLLFFYFFVYHIKYIRVNYIASYELDEDMDHMEFYGYYRVGDLKMRLGEEGWVQTFGELEGLNEKLDKLDDNTRIVISLGSGIRYFWIPEDEYDGFIRVKYKSKEPENKIYFYTTEYRGSMVDFDNY